MVPAVVRDPKETVLAEEKGAAPATEAREKIKEKAGGDDRTSGSDAKSTGGNVMTSESANPAVVHDPKCPAPASEKGAEESATATKAVVLCNPAVPAAPVIHEAPSAGVLRRMQRASAEALQRIHRISTEAAQRAGAAKQKRGGVAPIGGPAPPVIHTAGAEAPRQPVPPEDKLRKMQPWSRNKKIYTTINQ